MKRKKERICKGERASIKAVCLPLLFFWKKLVEHFTRAPIRMNQRTALNLHMKMSQVKIMVQRATFFLLHSFVCSFIRKLHPKNLFSGQNETSQNLNLSLSLSFYLFLPFFHTNTRFVRTLLSAFTWCNVSICMRFYFGNILRFECVWWIEITVLGRRIITIKLK